MDQKLIYEFLRQDINQHLLDINIAHCILYALRWDLPKAISLNKVFANSNAEKTGTEKADVNIYDLLAFSTIDQHTKSYTQDIISSRNITKNSKLLNDYLNMPNTTFSLPILHPNQESFDKFVGKELVEQSVLTMLEKANKLNWWIDMGVSERLYPIVTIGDGNCLLHATSLSIWGFHDRLLFLRKELHRYLTTDGVEEMFYRRWRLHLTKVNLESQLVYSEVEWRQEWRNIISMSSVEPRGGSGAGQLHTYEPLEEIHILVLAHVLKRPIIVFADTMLRDLRNQPIAPIPFGGLYLPLDLDPMECCKTPVLISYDMAHFSAIVQCVDKDSNANAQTNISYIPITDAEGNLLTLHFPINPGPDYIWDSANELPPSLTEKETLIILKQYMNIIDLFTEPDSEDEIEKRFSEVIMDNNDNENDIFSTNKLKAAKQIQIVAKQFGSIGKSMSKKIKTITKIGKTRKNNGDCLRILYAELNIKPYEGYETMLKSYMDNARERFKTVNEEKASKEKVPEVESAVSPISSPVMNRCDPNDNGDKSDDGVRMDDSLENSPSRDSVQCVNGFCVAKGSEKTNYLCQSCYNYQRRMGYEKQCHTSPGFGTGKSTFYRESDKTSYTALKNVPTYRPTLDQTLYLSKSTFYNDSEVPFKISDLWNQNKANDLKSEDISAIPDKTEDANGSVVTQSNADMEVATTEPKNDDDMEN